MLRRVAIVRTNVLEKSSASMEALRFSEMSVLTKATRRNIPENSILHIHHRTSQKTAFLTVRNTAKSLYI
jgi:hypothetical protein